MFSSSPGAPPVLIAGLGYLGAELARQLLARGRAVAAASRSAPDSTGSSAPPYPLDSCDLGDPASVSALAAGLHARKSSPRAVVHCASSGRGGPGAYQAVFVDGSRHLLAAFPGTPLFFTSSTSVYPQADGSAVSETSPAEPDRETGRLLRAAEDLVLASGGTVIRLAGLYGPGRSVHLKKFLEGSAGIESGPVSRLLNQIHRDDAAAAICHLLELPPGAVAGQIYNVADDTPLTQRACYEALARRFARPLPPEVPPDRDRKRGWTHKAVSNAKLRATGWRPRHPGFLEALDTDPGLLPSIQRSILLPDFP